MSHTAADIIGYVLFAAWWIFWAYLATHLFNDTEKK